MTLRVASFAMFDGRNECDMSKVSKFCLEKYETCVSVHLILFAWLA